jgi:hypothetical protein
MVAGRGQGALASAALLTIATPQCRPKDATAICHPGPSGGESAPPRAARPQTKFRPLAPSVPRPWNLGGSPAAPDLMHWKLSWRRCHTVSTTLPSGSPTGHTHPSASAEALGRLRGRQHTEASNPCANHSRAANLRSDVRWPIPLRAIERASCGHRKAPCPRRRAPGFGGLAAALRPSAAAVVGCSSPATL